MNTLKTLTDYEIATLTPLLVAGQPIGGATVVTEDVADLATEIAQHLANTGMLILLGTPKFTNGNETAPSFVVATIKQEILIGEAPAIWRNVADTNVHCQVAAQIIAQTLHGLLIPNFQRLKVLTGEPLGTFKGDERNPTIFQYYRLTLETALSLQPLAPAQPSLLPEIDSSAAIVKWAFRDQVTGQILWLSVKDGALNLSDS